MDASTIGNRAGGAGRVVASVCLAAALAVLPCDLAVAAQPASTAARKSSTDSEHPVISAYRRAGFTQLAADMEREAVPCAALLPERTRRGAGQSKIGGLPDLASQSLWPARGGKSLAFIAQVNLADLPAELKDKVPGGGLLSFFYDADQETWGFDPKDKGSWSVLFAREVPHGKSRVSFPSDLPEHARYRERAVRLQTRVSIPGPFAFASYQALRESQQDKAADSYDRHIESLAPVHQLFGLPAEIQGEMRLECQLASHGLYCGDSTGYSDPRRKELEAGAADWILLLQVDSDEETGMEWGDGGRLYFWITTEDLKEKRFDRAWMILQCY